MSMKQGTVKTNTIEQIRKREPAPVNGKIINTDGQLWYEIENVNAMTPFFMTITSASDVWNFIWSDGSLSAGRRDSDHAIFPYYTADKIRDMGSCTGSYTAVKISETEDGPEYFWEPFCRKPMWKTMRNLYKNSSGSRIVFEEINEELSLVFYLEWTSSEKYGLVRHVKIIDKGISLRKISVLDGCRNIMPACATSDFQNNNSVLLDAYKKTDLDEETGLSLFALSSIVTDKAEPNEALYANTCWFSTGTTIYLSPDTPEKFSHGTECMPSPVLKGQRPSCYTIQNRELIPNEQESAEWYQVFDTALEASAVGKLREQLADRKHLILQLEADIEKGRKQLESYIAEADGIQITADSIACLHHKANVMFNIMRGGTFADNNDIRTKDFIEFVRTKNGDLATKMEKLTFLKPDAKNATVKYETLGKEIRATGNVQLIRLYLEYLPLSFSRRHGDPSRPWNRFSIRLKDPQGNSILNYEGNWRDIFQNWEALAMSYPVYTTAMIAKFLDAVTADGYNPYRISKDGIDWEVPDPGNPWANIGYWNDHQIIYLCKLLELQYGLDSSVLTDMASSTVFTMACVPYKIKGYDDIRKNPRDTIIFDRSLNDRIVAEVSAMGTDAQSIHTPDGKPILVTLTAKLLQLILAKLANFVSGGGIWLNTQRPEWNDANNALAGWGLSMVTLYYVRRMILFMKKLYATAGDKTFDVPSVITDFLRGIASLYTSEQPGTLQQPSSRSAFTEKCGKLFETERKALYEDPVQAISKTVPVKGNEILTALDVFLVHIDYTIKLNRRNDGLYHSYNTLSVTENGMEIGKLQEMLEGQVAILSSGYLTSTQAIDLCTVLRNSRLYEKRQHSYILYPNRELPLFIDKNTIRKNEAEKIPSLAAELAKNLVQPEERTLVYNDAVDSRICHFNPIFRNSTVLSNTLDSLCGKTNEREKEQILELYEKTFNHRSFTGRSGTFYAYEGLGSIYWHMVSKLLLAIQENYDHADSTETAHRLSEIYYDVRGGLGFNKTPELYGAIPSDPYSHTPSGQGAKQPGMTGQVKEEIIARWGELGMRIENGRLTIKPNLLQAKEFGKTKSISFTRFGVKFIYRITGGTGTTIQINERKAQKTDTLSEVDSNNLFRRNGKIKTVTVDLPNLTSKLPVSFIPFP